MAQPAREGEVTACEANQNWRPSHVFVCLFASGWWDCSCPSTHRIAYHGPGGCCGSQCGSVGSGAVQFTQVLGIRAQNRCHRAREIELLHSPHQGSKRSIRKRHQQVVARLPLLVVQLGGSLLLWLLFLRHNWRRSSRQRTSSRPLASVWGVCGQAACATRDRERATLAPSSCFSVSLFARKRRTGTMPAHHHDMDMMGAPSPAASTESPMPPMAMEEVEHVMTGMRHGTYEGHALAGSLLIVWGAWWTVCFLQRFYSSYLHKASFLSLPQHTVPRAQWVGSFIETCSLSSLAGGVQERCVVQDRLVSDFAQVLAPA